MYKMKTSTFFSPVLYIQSVCLKILYVMYGPI